MLTELQTQQLYTFCTKHYVRYYDVQIELVDHLASAIEQLMIKDETLSFETALNKVYSGFGIFGFSKIVQEKEIQLQKQKRKKLWQAFVAYFTIPKIMFTLLLTVLFISPMYIFESIYVNEIFIYVVLCSALYALLLLIYVFVTHKIPQKKMLSYDIYMLPSLIFLIFFLPTQAFNILKVFEGQDSLLVQYSYAYPIAIFVLVMQTLFFTAFVDVYKKNYFYLKTNYPLAFK